MKTFRQYLIPSVIAQIFMSCYAIVDGIFIGSKMNDIGLAAINIAWPITAFIQAFGFALGISSGIYISRLKGRGNEEKVKKIKSMIFMVLLLTSILLGTIFFITKRSLLELFRAKGETLDAADKYITIILYGSIFQLLGSAMNPLIKNSGRVKVAMASSLLATFTNLVLDYLFIYVWEMGLEGAAIASVIGQGVAFSVCFIPYILEMKGIHFDLESLKEIFLGSLAPFILTYSYSIIIILTNALCEEYSGDAAVAAYTVLSYMLYVVGASASGASDAIQPLFSYHSEKKEYKITYKYLYKCMIVSFMIVLVFSILFYVFRNPIGRLYGLSSLGMDIFNSSLIYYLIGFLFVSLSKVLCSYLYSMNHKVLANALVILEPFIITPLLYAIFVKQMGTLGLFVSFLVIQVVLLIIAAIFYFISRRNHDGWIFNRRQAKGDDESNRLS